MDDLISRQAAIDAVHKKFDEVCVWDESGQTTANEVENILYEVPSADTERKIIYCKDCKFAHLTIKGEVKYCDVWFPEEKMYLSADDFCSSAEKRSE